ncbi:DGQHR domain-containing protein [Alkalihalobacillus sp. LMS6]|uniref:DNA sulfur modification protein DndB n=1 Tax=Alkalihalobacillus sp. LMS6 TaxID=2924034 RepID=UPI0020D14026|nr:DNA sulfur modification protein DndB [Alkalihalobacillus sp. LMS6]UTR06986.1 DGQHR domain-containing protein [Alkalihalobacillus sp. LMS6]
MSIYLKGSILPMANENAGIMSTQIPIDIALKFSTLDKTVNRDLSYNRFPNIVKYIKQGSEELGIYFPAFVFSFRGDLNQVDVGMQKLRLENENDLVIIDGQHRLKALDQFYLGELNNINLNNSNFESSITAQIYIGLTIEQERNLFIDINSKSKKVTNSLITKYDSRDIMNILTTDLYKISSHVRSLGIQFDKSRVYRPRDTEFTTSVKFKIFLSIILFGKNSLNSADLHLIRNNYDETLNLLAKFFDVFVHAIPVVPGDISKFSLGDDSMQKALANYLFKTITIDGNFLMWVGNWEDEVKAISDFNWSINNPVLKSLYTDNYVGSNKQHFYSLNNSLIGELESIITNKLE